MNESEITALARELANDLYNDDKSYNAILWWGEEPKERKSEELEHTLRFLLRRFSFVEKSKVKQIFQSRQNILANQDKYDRYIVDEASAEKRLMLCLFPEIAKEVNG